MSIMLLFLECPVDTYGDKAGLISECKRCPPNSGTKGKTQRLQAESCSCNVGYEKEPTSRKLICKSEKIILYYSTITCSELDILIFRPFLLLDVLLWRTLGHVLSRCALCHVVFTIDFYQHLALFISVARELFIINK